MGRGHRRQDILLDDVDRQDFVKALAEACQEDRLAQSSAGVALASTALPSCQGPGCPSGSNPHSAAGSSKANAP